MVKKTKCGLDLPRGVHENGSKLLIEFVFRGIRCRETLNLEVTKANIKLAERKRNRIMDEIEDGSFNYANYFPNSNNAKKFYVRNSNVLIEKLLREQIESYERQYLSGKKSIATYKSYLHIIEKHLLPTFGYISIDQLTPNHIKNWILSLKDLTSKRINTIIIPLRLVLDNALNNELIDYNPLDKIAIKALLAENMNQSNYEINPFTDEEKELIINTAYGEVKNIIQFGFWTGMRLGEILALRWDNIDFDLGIIKVVEAKVLGTIKTPKTKSGMRDVTMLPLVKDALLDQLKKYRINDFVFNHPRTRQPYVNNNAFRREWVEVLNRAGIKYRNPHQMRHTYASTLLLKGNKPLLVANQLGHKNLQMLLQVYGKYIPNKIEEIFL